jgi:hypothetical protein
LAGHLATGSLKQMILIQGFIVFNFCHLAGHLAGLLAALMADK